MPWYVALPITLFLFVFAPFFRKWIDLVIWPKLADSWAARSQAKLESRISKLQYDLKHPLEFSTLMIDGIGAILHAALQILIALWVVAPPWLPGISISLAKDKTTIIWTQCVIYAYSYIVLIALWTSFVAKGRQLKWPELHRKKLEKRVIKLTAKLERIASTNT